MGTYCSGSTDTDSAGHAILSPWNQGAPVYSSIVVKRVYESSEQADGTRLLIDGIWPRGISRSEFPDNAWRPDLAPSRELRQWYKHQPELFDEFTSRYRQELDTNDAVVEVLEGSGRLTLLTAMRQVEISHAAVLCSYLRERAAS